MRDLIVFGTCNLDLCLATERLPAPGASVIGTLRRFAGGKGANQAVAAARLGGSPLFYTRVGDDEAGAFLRRSLTEAGVRLDAVKTVPGVSSGTALIMVDHEGTNIIGIAPGANSEVAPADIDAAFALVASGGIVVVEMGLPLAALAHIFARSHERGDILIFNPAPVTGEISHEDWQRVHLITPNATEAEQLTGVRIAAPADAAAAAERLLAMGVRAAAVTLGEGGVLLADRTTTEHFPAFPVHAVDTTAAGDAFNGALALMLAEGRPMAEAIRAAMATAAICVTRPGAQGSMPTRAEVDDFLVSRVSGRTE